MADGFMALSQPSVSKQDSSVARFDLAPLAIKTMAYLTQVKIELVSMNVIN
jgi:hypothetical protein